MILQIQVTPFVLFLLQTAYSLSTERVRVNFRSGSFGRHRFHGGFARFVAKNPSLRSDVLHSNKFETSNCNEQNYTDEYDNENRDGYHKYSKIRKGEIYIEDDFLSPVEIDALRKDIVQLQENGLFKPSGLSNRVEGDKNIFGSTDRLTCTITPDLFAGQKKFSSARFLVEEKMEHLKQKLQVILAHSSKDGKLQPHRIENREFDLKLELSEMYYSISPKGSNLPRHQDERHEDTKGVKGYVNQTRRSISWLIYLNDENWGDTVADIRTNSKRKIGLPKAITAHSTHNAKDNGEDATGLGGELRAYCRRCCPDEYVRCGSNEGDLQVGWLRCSLSPSCSSPTKEDCEFEPIFLDSWVKTNVQRLLTKSTSDESTDSSLEWQPMSALYRLRRSSELILPPKDQTPWPVPVVEEYYNNEERNLSLREYISEPFGPNSPSWPLEQELEPIAFTKALALQLRKKDHRSRFVGMEDICREDDTDYASEFRIVDVVPRGGRLVLFDSVTVPHEVLEVTEGTRLAIAGWLHEPVQEFPDWYGT